MSKLSLSPSALECTLSGSFQRFSESLLPVSARANKHVSIRLASALSNARDLGPVS